MKNIIFVDIDGTILDMNHGLNEPSEKTRYAFKALKEEGNLVFICSGRPLALLDEPLLSLEPSGFVTCNGGYVEYNGEILFSKEFTKEQIEMIRNECNEKNYIYCLEDAHKIYVRELTEPLLLAFVRTWGCGNAYHNEDGLAHPCYQVMAACFTKEQCDEFIEKYKNDLDIRMHKGFTSFDINLYGVNKGTGVKHVLEKLDIPVMNSYAFGDGFNDFEMLSEVGNPIIMGNCEEALKCFGYEMTDHVLDDGFYNALVRHNLIKPLQ